MPQNGLHAIAGVLARRWMPQKEWLILSVLLGNMLPDLDNLAVAYATLTGSDTDGLHRTFTHSIFTIITVLVLFSLTAALTRNPRWGHVGVGLAVGISMHILFDLILWFNGVELLWPIRYEINFWTGITEPGWLRIMLETGEFLAFGLYFLLLHSLARRQGTDAEQQGTIKTWMYLEFALFLLFMVLFFRMGAEGLQYTIFGALYLISTIVAIVITVRMRRTVETLS